MPNPTAADMIRALKLKRSRSGRRPLSRNLPRLASTGWSARIDAVEIWHYYGGAPLKLEIVDGSKEEIFRLGADIQAGEVPQVTVPARAWQAAESLGGWTLTGCTVSRLFV
jgi:predicted cupin superfamily sugar epimerase